MGFELYLQCYLGGQPSGMPKPGVRALFPVVEEESEPNHWRVRYDSTNTCTVGVTPVKNDPSRIESLCIHRPCGDLRLFESVLAILRMGSVVLVFPGDAPPLVASTSVTTDLPKDLVESMGPPKCVHSAQEILEVIRNA